MNQLISYLPGLAFLVPIAMAWSHIKGFVTSLIRTVVMETQAQGGASMALLMYLRLHAKRMPTNVLKIASNWVYVKDKGNRILLYEGSRDLPSSWYWWRGNLFLVTEKRGHDKERGVNVDNLTSIRYLRGTVDAECLLKEAVEWFVNREKTLDMVGRPPRFYVKRFVGRANENMPSSGQIMEAEAKRVSMDSADENWRFARLINYQIGDLGYSSKLFFYVFGESAQRVFDDVSKWLKSQEWYEKRGLLHRRGALLYGPPGSGKSSLIRKVGQTLDIPVFSFELSTMTDSQFISYWDDARRSNPCILVMEDIDTVFNKRQPATANIKLSFECLLNCISGVEPAEGIYLFVTTNRLDYLDEALGIPNAKGVSTRPGRLDTCFYMAEITLKEKQQIVAHFLGEHPALGARLIEESNGCTAAQFSDMCAQKALELYWSPKS